MMTPFDDLIATVSQLLRHDHNPTPEPLLPKHASAIS
jgi:hypothetical protein